MIQSTVDWHRFRKLEAREQRPIGRVNFENRIPYGNLHGRRSEHGKNQFLGFNRL